MNVKRLRSTLVRHCDWCKCDREIDLPEHPAGLGYCSVCGAGHDLCDYPTPERREYFDCYEIREHRPALRQGEEVSPPARRCSR